MEQHPFSVRRWIYVPQVPDRRVFRLLPEKCMDKTYVEDIRVCLYESYLMKYVFSFIEISDVFAMLDMYDGITLVREEQDK